MKMSFNYLKASLLIILCFVASITSSADLYNYNPDYYYTPGPTQYLLNCHGCPKTGDQLEEELEQRGVEVIELGDQIELVLGVDRIFMPRSNNRLRYSQVETMKLVSQYLNTYNYSHITVYAHTDNVGSDKSKLKRTKVQAETIAAYLWSNGVGRIRAVGCGDTEPVASNQTVDGSAANRRIEIITSG